MLDSFLMPVLDNPKHEKFAQLVAKGKSQAEAYAKVYGGDIEGVRANASRLMTSNDNICQRVAEIQQGAASKVEWSLADRLKFLADIGRTAPGDIDSDSPLCQSYKNTADVNEIKMPDKLRAVELYGKLSGDQVERAEISIKIVKAWADEEPDA